MANKLTSREKARKLELKREKAKRQAVKNYGAYWRYVNPMLKYTRFAKYICETIDLFLDDKLVNENGEVAEILTLSAPPQHGKSEGIVKTLPSYVAQKYEMFRTILVAYNDTLAMSFNRLNKHKISTYDLFDTKMTRTSDADVEFDNLSSIRARGILSGITGNPADLIIVDDPFKNREEAQSDTVRDKVWDEFKDSILTRLSGRGKVIIIMTRWHEDDLVGRIKAFPDAISYDVNIPLEAEENDPLGRDIGEPLCPEIGKDAEWMRRKKNIYINDPKEGGLRSWLSLYQGQPSTPEGNEVKRHWWKYYDPRQEFIDTLPVVVLSVDAAYKDKEATDTDFVSIGVWGKKGAYIYLIDRYYARMSFTTTLVAIMNMLVKYPQITTKYIEEKANGSAIIDVLNNKIGGFIGINPRGSKPARMRAVAPWIESGNVLLPRPATEYGTTWVNEFIDNLAKFPNGTHDDDVDMTSQALKELITKPAEVLKMVLPKNPIFNTEDELRGNKDEFGEQADMIGFTGGIEDDYGDYGGGYY